MSLFVLNTLTGRKEPFEPISPPEVRMYVCGPTVYDHIHVGNARSAVAFDAVRKWLIFSGYRVRYVVNLTDVDDKILARAAAEGRDWRELAEACTASYLDVMRRLWVDPPDVQPRATDHVPAMISLIEELIRKGSAYEAGGDVLFHAPSFPAYGRLSGKNLEEILEGARVERNPARRHPTDFVLWKAAKPGEPAWNSPWGPGRPGWHIECSAMVRALLGDSIDVHGGGVDLVFPHHENEIAQCEAATGRPYVKYWLHNGFLEMGGRKMSKSLGNIQKAKDALSRWPGEVLRYFFLSAHYRSPLAFEEEALDAAKRGWEEFARTPARLEEALASPEGGVGEDGGLAAKAGELEHRIREAMDDDFNTPRALGALFDLAREARSLLARGGAFRGKARRALESAREGILRFGRHFGLLPAEEGGVPEEVRRLAEERVQKRKERDFAAADRLREEIRGRGFTVEDAPGGAYRLVPLPPASGGSGA